MTTRWLRWTLRAFLVLLALLLIAVAVAGWAMRASLPRLGGGIALEGMSADVEVQRDALGVVTITAGNELDAMRALGYVHAQERFFEMDLMRRTSAGELAELFGARALDLDRRRRVHRMRARVVRDLDLIAGARRDALQAYTDGVNAGLAGLRARPWAYLLLRAQPAPWRLEDTPLVGHAMYFDLQDASNARELALWRLKPHLPPAAFALLAHSGSRWDAPVQGEARGDAQLPSPAELDLRRTASRAARRVDVPTPMEVGSNNFAVSGALTRDGRAIVADDMHLSLRAPNIWFRARLHYPDAAAPGGAVDVSGFTLPGLPLIVVGSNTHVAWGFTNSYGDWLDWQRVPACESPCAIVPESIRVAGGEPVRMDVEETPWGPVLHRDADGTGWALRWVAHLPGALTLDLADLARASDLDAAMRVADRTGLPAQNLVIGDRSGRIAWRLLGPVPQRGGDCAPSPADARTGAIVPGDAPSGCAPWTVSPVIAPSISAAETTRLWTANSRVVDGDALDLIGDGGYALGTRAWSIRDALQARDTFTERDLLAVQLDDRAHFLQPWWQLLRAAAKGARTPALQALADADRAWPTHATPESVSYRLVRAWRLAVHERIAAGLTAPARAALGGDAPMPSLPQFEGVVWPIVRQQPAHMLPPAFATWEALFEDAASEVRTKLSERGPLGERSWGERNTAAICHPLAGALPGPARRWLCMPAEPLRGDSYTPRAQGPDFGASQRMVVAPGHERDGIIHMPGGQSGHPMSPFWAAGHDDWVHGRPTPFLPGAPVHRLTITPAPR